MLPGHCLWPCGSWGVEVRLAMPGYKTAVSASSDIEVIKIGRDMPVYLIKMTNILIVKGFMAMVADYPDNLERFSFLLSKAPRIAFQGDNVAARDNPLP